MAVTITFPESVTSTNVIPPPWFPKGVTSEEPLLPIRYAFFVWSSDTNRSSNGFDSFLILEGDAESRKLQLKLVVAAWLIGIDAITTRKRRTSRIIVPPSALIPGHASA